MKLYFSPGACSLAPHIVLREAGLDFTLAKVSTKTKTLADGTDYWPINPKGQVPTLEMDDGQRLTEGPVITQFIADTAGSTALMPAAGTPARYRVMEWQNFIGTEIHKGYTPLFNPNYDDATKATMKASLRKKYEYVDKQLAAGPFLIGDAFTAADAYLFAVTRWAPHLKVDLSGLPNVERFMTRAGERPAVQAALAAEA